VPYFDNAATSHPKPEITWKAMEHYLKQVGCNPGRGGYAGSIEAGRIVFAARERLKALFNAPSEKQVIFTPNVTYALNFAIKGLLSPGDHVILSSMEHNSVVRPLRFMEKHYGVKLSIVPCDRAGRLDPEDVRRALRENTKLVVLTHASNVTGTILPVAEVAAVLRESEAFFVLDTAQTAGVLDIDFQALGLDFLAFTGHKALYGPPGTGGFVISERAAERLVPFVQGGTGSKSDLGEQPDFLPDKFEAGTANTVGIAGLGAGIQFVTATGLEKIREHEQNLTRLFLAGIEGIPGVRVYGPEQMDERVATVSLTLDGADLGEVAARLDAEYGIMVRSGLHCSPLAHKTIGTFPAGTLRFSFGYFNTEEEVLTAVEALQALAREY
jgi:cysteine desulfurase family protein